MAKQKKFIDGIFNYCDRWCERCPKTSSCAVFESSNNILPEEQDENNETFWNKVSNIFSDTIAQLQKIMADENIVITKADEEAIKLYMAKQKQHVENTELHPLINYCKQYEKEAHLVLQKSEAIKEQKENYIKLVELGIKDFEETKKELDAFNDYIEIVQWFVFFIRVKFVRAFISEDEADDESIIKDSNGSAKVALIAIDKSMLAWQQIMHLVPAAENEIIPLLGLLQKLRNLGEHCFPNARAFIRVGLDD